ncbi:Transposon Ty3-I Gag-Pol polyprotein [Rhizoctonia solani]|uniref:RNA-directed DNA polymerase n=1 Tax=Rhizoctonia solani TaxID=456999 RepID=A0A0K6GIH5_9AGAM|nr:Transposon Ty3-I Gag-Pol polyprotein [Rhizoctonia solani]
MSSKNDSARALSGHGRQTTSDEPHQRSRSASVASTTPEVNPFESTPRPRSNKSKEPGNPAHTAATRATTSASRPDSRASAVPTTAGRDSASGARTDRLKSGEVGEQNDEGKGAFAEANTGIIGIEIDDHENHESSNVFANMGLHAKNALAPTHNIVSGNKPETEKRNEESERRKPKAWSWQMAGGDEASPSIGKHTEEKMIVLPSEEPDPKIDATYDDAMVKNGGREDPNIFGTTEVTNEPKGKNKSNVELEPAKGRLSLGVRMQDLEGERKVTHTPAPMPSSVRNRGLPTGGYLHDRLTTPAKSRKEIANNGDPSDSSDSSSSSDSDSDDFNNMNPHELAKYIKKLKKKNKEKKEKEKIKKLQLSGFKTKLPMTYSGTSDFDTFEQFMYEIELWVEDTGFEDHEAVRHIKGFLKDKAATFYMSHIAPESSKYTLTVLFQELFDYCFLPDIQARIRHKFSNMNQTNRGFKDFYRELKKIQRRLTDINDKAVAVRMWEGAQSYLRIEWARNSYSAEHNTLEELEELAIRYENAEKIRRAEENRSNDWRSTYKGKKPDYRKPREEEKKQEVPKYDRHGDKQPKKEKVPRLSAEQFVEYRASGKCTFCHEVGHITKDCPKRNYAKPKGLSSSAVSFKRIHELEGTTESSRRVYSVSFEETHMNNLKEPQEIGEFYSIEQTMDICAIKKNPSPPMEWNTSKPRDKERKVPQPIVLEVFIDRNPAGALLDSGSHGDFVSTTLVDQLRLKKTRLAKPIGLQMAVSGSKSSINWCANAQFQYQGIDEPRTFNVMNIENYDLILGTPFLFQFKITFGINPPNVLIGSNKSNDIQGGTVTTIALLSAELLEDELEKIHAQLSNACKDLFKTAVETLLPPFRVINHRIPLIDNKKPLPWRASKCPEKLKDQWEKKRDAYIQSGRWRFATGRNATPMLFITKKSNDDTVKLRTVLDKRALNDNTHKLASPLPDQADILWRVQKHKYQSLIDGKDAYEQIRVEPEDVPNTLFITPDGTMVSEVMQIGDTNASATYQSLMNVLLEKGRGKYWDVFLDDIVVYTDTIEEHVQRMHELFNILRREKLYLSTGKIQILVPELQILGHVIDKNGIRMDPDKVDSMLKWKVPTTKEQIMAFLGAVGYLAPNCEGVRIPMGVLSSRSASNKHWNWDHTAQRAFDEVKSIVQKHHETHHVALDYSKEAPPINLVTDACLTGASGVLSQGKDISTAKVVVFWSGKFTSTQQNYAVHELELLAIKESLDQFRHLLVGTNFRIYTDHRALEHFKTQKDLSLQQVRWSHVFNKFDFDIIYIPGETNKLADTLSRLYENEQPGTVCAQSEYVQDRDELPNLEAFSADLTNRLCGPITRPILVAEEAKAVQLASVSPEEVQIATGLRRSTRERKPVERLEVSHVPTHKRAPPKWKVNKIKAREEAATENEKSTTKYGNATKVAEVSELKEKEIAPHILEKSEAEEKPTVIAGKKIFYDPTPNLLDKIKGRYVEDKFYKFIIENPSHFKKFEVQNDLIYIKESEGRALCVPNIEIGGQKLREVVIRDAHVQTGHSGRKRTLYALRGKAWWKSMVMDIQEYCALCHVCMTTKHQTQSKMGLLTPMDPEKEPWACIQIDFVSPLPESENLNGKWDMLCVVIDQVTSMIRLIPTRQNYKARDMAEVLFNDIFKLHGLPKAIVSDRDKLFDSKFWRELCRLTKTELRMSSGYHPETDGLTERSHKTSFQMIRQSIEGKQEEWVKHIPGVEHAMNLSQSEATGFSPFFLNYGRYPTGSRWESDSIYPGVRKFLRRQKESLAIAHDAIIDACTRMTAQANQHHRSADITEGDRVYLSTKNLRLPKKMSRKLARKYIGPMKVLKEIVKGNTYELKLPSDLKDRGIHPVFHASLLRIHVPNDDKKFPARAGEHFASLTDAPREWGVKAIVQHAGKGKETRFEVEWANGVRTWEEYRDIKHLEALDEYLELQGVESVMKLPWTAEYGLEEMEFGVDSDEEQENLSESSIKEQDGSIQVNSITIASIIDELVYYGRPMHPSSNPTRHNGMYTFTAEELVDCGIYRANLFCVRRGTIANAGTEPPKYQSLRALLRVIQEQETAARPNANPDMELLAASMRELTVALGRTNMVERSHNNQVNGTTTNTYSTTVQSRTPLEPNTYTQNANRQQANNGLRAYRSTLSERIGARVSPYERRPRGGVKV